jgi:hypothetical protein
MDAGRRRALGLAPGFALPHAGLGYARDLVAPSLAARNRHPEAAVAVAEARKIDPLMTIASFDAIVGHVPEAMRQRVYAALRSAGLASG